MEEKDKSSEEQDSPSLETIELGQNAILNRLNDLCGHFKPFEIIFWKNLLKKMLKPLKIQDTQEVFD